MRHFIITAVLGLSLIAPALAGPGHSHDPITKEQAAAKAAKKRDQLVKAGKLDKSWGGVAVSTVEKKIYAKGPEWVVTFRNEAAADPARRTLYIFYALDGHYLAANFSGK